MAVFTVSEAFNEGWKLTKPNLKTIWKFVLVLIGVYFGIALVGSMFKSMQSLFSLVNYVVSLALSIGFIRVTLKIADGKPVEIKELFMFEGRYLWVFFAASILYSLIVMGGLILLIVPGIIWGIMFSQYKFAVVDKAMGIKESLAYSRQITSGNKWPLLWLCLLVGLMNMGAALLFLIPLIWTIPLSTMIMVWAYRKMGTSKTSEVA